MSQDQRTQDLGLMSPTEMILNGGDGSTSGNNSESGKGMDPYTQDKLLALAQAAYDAGNFELAAELAALVDNGLATQSRTRSAQKGEEANQETAVSRGSAAPAPETRPEADRNRPEVEIAVAPAPESPRFSQSAANEAFRAEYGKVAYKAYLETGKIADALQVADGWAAANNGAVAVTTGRESAPDRGLDAAAAAGAQIIPVADSPERQAMAKLVNFNDFPTFAFGSPDTVTLRTVAAPARTQDGPEVGV